MNKGGYSVRIDEKTLSRLNIFKASIIMETGKNISMSSAINMLLDNENEKSKLNKKEA